MGKSSRASATKKNNSALKKKVFGPVEIARSERLSAKLLELASQAKAPRETMEVEKAAATEGDAQGSEVNAMDVDSDKKRVTETAKKTKPGRVQKSRHRRARNEIAFAKHPMKSKKKGRKG